MIHSQFFFNRCFDKSKLKGLISWSLRNYGEAVTLNLVEKLKDVGFLWATQAGISLSIDDLKIPREKSTLLLDAEAVSNQASSLFLSGNLTSVERLQQLIDAWHRTSEILKQEVVTNFRKTDPLNPVYMMAFSGARGNISQVRQLVGMRGLMADPQGRIIDFPIRSNFREGLTLTEYVISCYGARKGIVDTALRTATSGYLTRRLVDVAQHVVVSLYDCETSDGIPLTPLKQGAKILLPLSDRILGRVLAEEIPGVAGRNTCISEYLAYKIAQTTETVLVRSPLLCKSRKGICQLCYGWSLAHNELVSIGEAVGIIAAQSIGEPGTQLTMRTFHTGGVFSGEIIDQISTPVSGSVKFVKPLKGSLVRTSYGKIGFLSREAGSLKIFTINNEVKEISFPAQSILFVRQGQIVSAEEILLEYASAATDQDQGIQATQLVVSPQKGEVFFEDVVIVKDELNTEVQSLELGSFWLLTSSVYSNSLGALGYLNFSKGDLIKEKAPLNTTNLIHKTNLFSQLVRGNKLISSKQSEKENFPQLCGNIGDMFISNIFYRSGSYLTQPSLQNFSEFRLPTEKTVIFNYFQKSLLTLFSFSQSLRSSTTSIATPVPNLSVFLTTNNLWFLLTNSRNMELNATVFPAKVKLFNFAKQCRTEKLNQSNVHSVISRKKGLYSFRVTVKKPSELHQKYYISKPSFVNFEKTSLSWFAQLNLKELILLKQDKLQLQHSQIENFNYKFVSTSAVSIERQVYKPLLKQLPVYFLFSALTRKTNNCSKVATSVLNQKVTIFQTYLTTKSASLSLINSYLTSFSQKTLLTNKQESDGSFSVKSIVQFDYQPLENSLSTNLLICKFSASGVSDKIFWHLSSNPLQPLSIFTKTNIVLPNTKSRTLFKKVSNSFDWKPSKRKMVQDTFILAQLDEKTVDTIEVIKFLEQKEGLKMLSLNKSDLTGLKFSQSDAILKTSLLGSLIRPGTEISLSKTFNISGQIISINRSFCLIRKALPILFSSKAQFHVFHGDFIDKGLPLITLTYKRLTTGDIVQGIPRIEQLFEARQTTTLLHEQLQELFEIYRNRMRLDLAARKSFQKIQRILIDSIQAVYQSQGVTISDKHLEVIVRQMTSTVRILEGGRTRLLRGELKSIDWIEKINLGIDIQKAEYEPILLGITKASLETESFISAASFQETTRTLSRAAIEGRTDFLRGLKENVILGHRVPAGTGAPLISYLTKFSFLNLMETNRENSSDLQFLFKD